MLKTDLSVGFDRMHKTGCSGDLSWPHLSHHKLESVKLITVIIGVVEKINECNTAWRDGSNK